MAEQLLTPEDVARRLNIKPRTALEYLAPGGRLHHLRIELGPKTIRVSPDAFERFIQQSPAEYVPS